MCPNMIVEVVRMPRRARVVMTSIHWAVLMRPCEITSRTLVVEDLGRGAGQRVRDPLRLSASR